MAKILNATNTLKSKVMPISTPAVRFLTNLSSRVSSPLLMPQRLPSDSASKLLQQLCETKIHAEQALEFLERVILKYSISEGNSLTRDNSQDDGLSDEEVDLTTRALIHVLEQSLLVPC